MMHAEYTTIKYTEGVNAYLESLGRQPELFARLSPIPQKMYP